MKTERNILIAFLLNLGFSIFEVIGGIFTGSVAIISDALHDLGDAMSIGISLFLERKSKRAPDHTHTYGYARYSVLGGLITTVILLAGSLLVIVNAVHRILNPTPIHYDGMIVFAIVGAGINLCAAFFTREGDSLNQKAVNLHMLEDVLGWLVVLVGAVIMRFTDLSIIDPLMSIGVAIFILINAWGTLSQVLNLFLVKTPEHINLHELEEHLTHLEGVENVHHLHVWSMSGQEAYATLHAVSSADPHEVKEAIREELKEHGIFHVTIELEQPGEHCHDPKCQPYQEHACGCHHHHHHGHHHHGHHHEHHHH